MKLQKIEYVGKSIYKKHKSEFKPAYKSILYQNNICMCIYRYIHIYVCRHSYEVFVHVYACIFICRNIPASLKNKHHYLL